MNREIPRARCVQRVFGALAADPGAAPWQEITPFVLADAVTGNPPQQQTWVRVGWNETELRVLFECEDPDPWATITQRDGELFREETVEIFFDPIGDLEAYYEIEVNPLGTLLDIFFRRSRSGYKGDWAWDCDGLQQQVCRTSRGWNAELIIPFAAIGEKPRDGTIWRVNFARIERPGRDGSMPRELSAWSPPLRETFHTPERFGYLEFADV